MLRSILIPLDGSDSTRSAVQLALQLARRHKTADDPVKLTGIAVLDRPTIERPQAVPAGATAFKKERDEKLLDDADQKTREFLEEFRATCAGAEFECELVRVDGTPYEEIERASGAHDMIFIGRHTNFHFTTRDDDCETFQHLLRDHPRPVVVTPLQRPEGKNVVIAYDGSLASSRTLHMFALLHLNLGEMDVHVVTIDSQTERAERKCSQAIELLARHEIQASPQVIISRGNTSDVLMQQIDELHARLVVMGTFGHQGLESLMFGSTTRAMLDKCNVPMFLFH